MANSGSGYGTIPVEDYNRLVPAIMRAMAPATEPVHEDWVVRRVMFQNFNPWDDGHWKPLITRALKFMTLEGKLKATLPCFNTSLCPVHYYEIANPLDKLAHL